ncbi:VCBS repeat-containing protein [Streptomyces sp. p1417]|uniref:VCBS repeat-containing protein n=1 Tax=Streptomyces typhae TaxID=2681492 RepID=A0A6L6X660_9ACTN|nr:VCBS repeat-containing protein [Streptomyces typhae]MVO89261.1 VCBS repeat-containing protein [Streptomyces typhae]
MPHVRSRWIAAPLAAASVGLAYAACQAGAVGPETDDARRSSRTTAVPMSPCLAGATTLVGDLDGDGRPDRIGDPGRTGTRVTVQWGAARGSFGPRHAVKDLLGTEPGEAAVTVEIADFTDDGILDIVVSPVGSSAADSSAPVRAADYRPGPLRRADLVPATGSGVPGGPPALPADGWKRFYEPCS